jgi:hypothetical protein
MIPCGYSPSIMEKIELVGFKKSATLTSMGCYALHEACWVCMLRKVLSKYTRNENIRIFCIFGTAAPLFVTFFPMVLTGTLWVSWEKVKEKFWKRVREEGALPDNAGGAVSSQNSSPCVPPCAVLIWRNFLLQVHYPTHNYYSQLLNLKVVIICR